MYFLNEKKTVSSPLRYKQSAYFLQGTKAIAKDCINMPDGQVLN